ncbi:MAG: hypothetical protein JOY84_17085 [Curvibacter sp.]|nr:hypothetical protein [Curvibacter sp.]
MNRANALKRLQQLIWVLIYGGLLSIVLGVATERSVPEAGLPYVLWGAIAAFAGVVLIGVRSLFHPHHPPH